VRASSIQIKVAILQAQNSNLVSQGYGRAVRRRQRRDGDFQADAARTFFGKLSAISDAGAFKGKIFSSWPGGPLLSQA